MEKLTGSTCKSLMEAYDAVYDTTRSKLEEEQINEFNDFINLLIDEGYDLSEYTYDELYEGWKEKVLQTALKYGGKALQAGKGLAKTAWKGTSVQTSKGVKNIPGAGQEAKAHVARTANFAVKFGVPVAAAGYVLDKATGGALSTLAQKGSQWGSVAQQKAQQAAQSVPSPGQSTQEPSGARTAPPTPKPKKLFPEGLSLENIISEGPDWNSAPKPKGVAVLTLGGERKVFIPGLGWQFPKTARRWARSQGYTDWNKIPNPSQPTKPAATKPEPAATKPEPAATKPEPATTPAPAAAAATQTRPPAATKSAPTRQTPAPAQTGDKAKDTASWAKANPTLAAKVTSAGTQKGTGQSDMAKQAAELRGMQKASQERQAAQSGPMYSSPDVKSKMSSRTKTMLGLKDSYDIVLDYLLSQGHVETLDEALYVMMEMDGETIKSIIEGSGVVTGAAKAINTVLKPTNQTPEQEKKAVGSITKGLDVVAKPIKSILSPVDNSPKAQQLRMNKYRTIN